MCLIFLVTAAIIGAIVVKVTGIGDAAKKLPGKGDGDKNVRCSAASVATSLCDACVPSRCEIVGECLFLFTFWCRCKVFLLPYSACSDRSDSMCHIW